MTRYYRPVAIPLAIPLAMSMACFMLAGTALADPYPGAETLPEIKLSLTEYNAPDSTVGKSDTAFINYVHDASGGRITIEPYWSSALMSITETPANIGVGLADMGLSHPVYTPSDFPIVNWFTTLASEARGGNPFGQLSASGAVAEFNRTNPAIIKEFNEHGLHILGGTAGNAYDLLCKTQVRTLADFRGKRIRTPNQAFAKEVAALGAIAVPIVAPEIYEAFSRGIIDCVILQPFSYLMMGLHDIPGEKYWISLELSGWLASYFVFNKDKWESLPPLAQQILNDAMAQYTAVMIEQTYKDHQLFADIVSEGEKIRGAVEVDDEVRATLRAHQLAEIEAMKANPPPGVESGAEIVDNFLALLDKWRGIVRDDLGIAEAPRDVTELFASWRVDRDFAPYQQRLAEEIGKTAQ